MILAVLLLLLNVVVYGSVGGFGFVNWDDPADVYENPMVLGGLSTAAVWWALTSTSEPYWQPVTWLSHLAVVSMFGLDAGAHHAVNVVLHAINCILVFVVLHRSTRARWPSAFVAAVFAAHPLHVESVAWVTERKDLLSGLFWLLALWAYARYAARPSVGRYVEVAVWFVLGVMSKPMVVTLPLVLLLVDFWPLNRVARGWRVKEKLPLFAISAAVSVLTFVIQKQVGAVAGIGALGVWPRVANAIVSYVRYLGKTIWPSGLMAFYPMQQWPVAIVLGAALLIIAVTVIAWRLRETRPYVLFGWLYYLVTLLPVIGFLQAGEQSMADRFMYLPLIGPLVIVAWGSTDLARAFVPAASRRAVLGGAAAVVIAASAFVARTQAAAWTESLTLWQHAILVDPHNYIAHEKLGAALRDLGRVDEARASFEQARKEAPPNSPVFLATVDNLIGMTFLSQGRLNEALAAFTNAAGENPMFAEARNNRGNALAAAGQFDQALPEFDAAIQLKPSFVEPRVGRGGALIRLNRISDAIDEFRRVVALAPNVAEGHNGLGSALAIGGDVNAAAIEYATAIRLKPGLASAHFNLAVLLVKNGNLAEARASLERALAADPNYAQARQLLDALAR